MRRLFICCLVLILAGCTPGARQMIKDTAWDASLCSLHSSLSCSGQAVGVCSVESSESFLGFSKCLIEKSRKCVGAGAARCALSGAIKAAGTTLIAAGGTSCTTDQDLADVSQCVESKDPKTEGAAVQAVSSCWVEQCAR